MTCCSEMSEGRPYNFTSARVCRPSHLDVHLDAPPEDATRLSVSRPLPPPAASFLSGDGAYRLPEIPASIKDSLYILNTNKEQYMLAQLDQVCGWYP
jgi:hypothetical protein